MKQRHKISSAEPASKNAKRPEGKLLPDDALRSPNSQDDDLAADARDTKTTGRDPDCGAGPAAKPDPLEANLGTARSELLQLAEGVTTYVTNIQRENPDEPPTSERCYRAYDLLLRIYRQAERFSQVEVKLRGFSHAKEQQRAQALALGRGHQAGERRP